jgi:hypothetical protein
MDFSRVEIGTVPFIQDVGATVIEELHPTIQHVDELLSLMAEFHGKGLIFQRDHVRLHVLARHPMGEGLVLVTVGRASSTDRNPLISFDNLDVLLLGRHQIVR